MNTFKVGDIVTTSQEWSDNLKRISRYDSYEYKPGKVQGEVTRINRSTLNMVLLTDYLSNNSQFKISEEMEIRLDYVTPWLPLVEDKEIIL